MEMARQQASFQDFNDAAQKVAENVDEESGSVKQIQDQMEEFNERWNGLTSQVTQRLTLVCCLYFILLACFVCLFKTICFFVFTFFSLWCMFMVLAFSYLFVA